jgi:hypothetical protein
MNKLIKIVNVTIKKSKTFILRGIAYSLLNIKYKVLFKNKRSQRQQNAKSQQGRAIGRVAVVLPLRFFNGNNGNKRSHLKK